MKKTSVCIILISLTMIFFGCNSSKKNAKSSDLPLVGTQWNLVSIENENITNDFALRPFITFDSVGGINGNLGCNSVFGNYELLKKHKIIIEYKGSTKRLCPKMEVEKKFRDALKSDIDSYQIKNNELTLFKGKEEILKFEGVSFDKVE